MTKYQIKHRLTGAVLFEHEIDEQNSGMAARHALEAAVKSGADLRCADFSGVNLNDAQVSGASFDGASFDHASFVGASFDGASFDGASFYGASFDHASFVGVSFDGASFDGASFVGASFDRASFVGASFVGASFVGASFDRASFDGASFYGASFVGASFDGASFVGASFVGETISKTPIQISGITWDVLITDGYMRIGCQRHTHAQWRGFDSEDIAAMERRAPEFWAAYRDPLLAMCNAHAPKVEQQSERVEILVVGEQK